MPFLSDCADLDAKICAAVNQCQQRVNSPVKSPSPEMDAACASVMAAYRDWAAKRVAKQEEQLKQAQEQIIKDAAQSLKK